MAYPTTSTPWAFRVTWIPQFTKVTIIAKLFVDYPAFVEFANIRTVDLMHVYTV